MKRSTRVRPPANVTTALSNASSVMGRFQR